MDSTTVILLLGALFGAGGITALAATIFRAVKDIRSGSRTKIRDVMDDLTKNADNAEKRADEAEERTRSLRREYEELLAEQRRKTSKSENERDMWRMAAARYAMQIVGYGHDPIPPFGEGWPQDPGGSTP